MLFYVGQGQRRPKRAKYKSIPRPLVDEAFQPIKDELVRVSAGSRREGRPKGTKEKEALTLSRSIVAKPGVA